MNRRAESEMALSFTRVQRVVERFLRSLNADLNRSGARWLDDGEVRARSLQPSSPFHLERLLLFEDQSIAGRAEAVVRISYQEPLFDGDPAVLRFHRRTQVTRPAGDVVYQSAETIPMPLEEISGPRFSKTLLGLVETCRREISVRVHPFKKS
jgi:hypothetical protein